MDDFADNAEINNGNIRVLSQPNVSEREGWGRVKQAKEEGLKRVKAEVQSSALRRGGEDALIERGPGTKDLSH